MNKTQGNFGPSHAARFVTDSVGSFRHAKKSARLRNLAAREENANTLCTEEVSKLLLAVLKREQLASRSNVVSPLLVPKAGPCESPPSERDPAEEHIAVALPQCLR
jgi:hypothetical protein